MNPAITIDGITVTLLQKFVLKGDYKSILYTLTEDIGIQKYVAYKSKSEGLWRLCWLNEYTQIMQKGDDYITTTQIHMSLQCFFESNYETLPEVTDSREIIPYVDQKNIPEDPKRMERIEAALLPSKSFPTPGAYRAGPPEYRSSRSQYTERYPNEVKRVYREAVYPVFTPLLALIRPGEGLDRFVYIFEHIVPKALSRNELGRLIKTGHDKINENYINYKVSGRNLRKPAMDYYFQTLIEMIQANASLKTLAQPYMEIEANRESEYYNPKYRPVVLFRELPKEQYDDVYRIIVSIVSKYIQFFFKTLPIPSTYVCNIDMEIPESVTHIQLHVYRRTIQLIKGNDMFDLYYAVYTIPNTSSSSSSSSSMNSLIAGTYKIILNLLPSPSKFGPFGLNQSYISTGIYVYKMFEYAKQFYGRVTLKDPKPTFGNYVFLGDLLTNMWPLQEVREEAIRPTRLAPLPASPPSSPRPSGGGRKRTYRSKTKKVHSRRAKSRRPN
jgi:hypothetical protein